MPLLFDFFSSPAFIFILDTAKNWWWLFLPFILVKPLKYLWIWWRVDVYDSTHGHSIMEIFVPPDVERPMKAMENVFAGLWQIYDPPNARERWFEGQYQQSLSVELVSAEGEIHFYIRYPSGSRQTVEASIYSQYPEAELQEVEDYTEMVPPDVPNREWELWGASYGLSRQRGDGEHGSFYPIKTYPDFFESSPSDKQEYKVDPMALTVENLTHIGKGEHLWVQIVATPVHPRDTDYVDKGKELVDVLANRKSSTGGKPPTIPFSEDLAAVSSLVLLGQERPAKMVGGEEEEGLLAPELRLTPGERTVVQAVEQKLSKPMFNTHSRFAYVAKRESYFGPAKALAFGYYNQFQTAHLNSLVPILTTKSYNITSFFLDKRRKFLKQRRLFRYYGYRLPPFFPSGGGTFYMNIEELATMFHFPGRISVPSGAIPRVGTRKREAPPGLPLGE